MNYRRERAAFNRIIDACKSCGQYAQIAKYRVQRAGGYVAAGRYTYAIFGPAGAGQRNVSTGYNRDVVGPTAARRCKIAGRIAGDVARRIDEHITISCICFGENNVSSSIYEKPCLG